MVLTSSRKINHDLNIRKGVELVFGPYFGFGQVKFLAKTGIEEETSEKQYESRKKSPLTVTPQ